MKSRDQEICQRKLIQYNSITLYNSKKQTSINIISTQTLLRTSNSLRAIPLFSPNIPPPPKPCHPFPPGLPSPERIRWCAPNPRPIRQDETKPPEWGGLKLWLPLLAPPGCPPWLPYPPLFNQQVGCTPKKTQYWIIGWYNDIWCFRLRTCQVSARFWKTFSDP